MSSLTSFDSPLGPDEPPDKKIQVSQMWTFLQFRVNHVEIQTTEWALAREPYIHDLSDLNLGIMLSRHSVHF